ncbi:hypothetical protein AB0E04_42950 [Streptomyces sp. NPDC048251]|uniref:hypothetical protein n=1 Tax=Streptomyces sp. NPDC048251 TaxID=3154501 RepID=UPI00343F4B78
MDAYLVKPCQGFGARRAHYTIASLIALERPVPDWTETTPSSPAHRGLDLDDPLQSESALLDGWSRRPNLGRTLADAARAHPHTAAGWQREVEVMGVLSADLLHTRLPPRHPELKGTVEALNRAVKTMHFLGPPASSTPPEPAAAPKKTLMNAFLVRMHIPPSSIPFCCPTVRRVQARSGFLRWGRSLTPSWLLSRRVASSGWMHGRPCLNNDARVQAGQ